jgi:hypothetical protein
MAGHLNTLSVVVVVVVVVTVADVGNADEDDSAHADRGDHLATGPEPMANSAGTAVLLTYGRGQGGRWWTGSCAVVHRGFG